jgi:hypothetical protein
LPGAAASTNGTTTSAVPAAHSLAARSAGGATDSRRTGDAVAAHPCCARDAAAPSGEPFVMASEVD